MSMKYSIPVVPDLKRRKQGYNSDATAVAADATTIASALSTAMSAIRAILRVYGMVTDTSE